MPTKRSIRWLALCGALAAGSAAHAAESSSTARWLDVESRIQYAYYTEDRRALANIADALAADSAPGGERPYYLALASYRVAELAGTDHPEEVRKPAERCASSLGHGADAGPGAAERLALQATCLHLLAATEPLRAPYLGMKSGSAMRKAIELAPRNPRVLLLRALADRDRQNDPQAVIGELQQAVAAFELERQGVERTPGWGAAEAYTFLGRSLLERGQPLAARGALEHALLLMPDFALAHRLMARITAG